jgi:DNA-binding NarL/FixJ family response regulator
MEAPRVLIAIQPRMYAEVLAFSLGRQRPNAEVSILGPSEEIEDAVQRLRSHLIVANRVPRAVREGASFWVELAEPRADRGVEPLSAQISADGHSRNVEEVSTAHAFGPGPGRGDPPSRSHPGRGVIVSVVRVHLADDHTMFREGLEAILSSREEVEIVGRSSTGKEAAALVGKTKPDLVITQLDMQIKTAEEILQGIKRASPDSRIVVLTMFDNLNYLKALSRLGIDAYLHKTSSTEELIATIDAVSHWSDEQNMVISMPRGLLERMGEEPMGALSERETEVLVLVARGLSNEQIAQELYVSEATVKRHLANIYQKIGVRSRNQAVKMALMEQWIGLSEITEATDGHGKPGG